MRGAELASHPFYAGVLYQPERSSLRDAVHPLIVSFVKAAAAGS